MKEVGNLLGKITDTMTFIDQTCQIDGQMFLILRDFLRFLYFFRVSGFHVEASKEPPISNNTTSFIRYECFVNCNCICFVLLTYHKNICSRALQLVHPDELQISNDMLVKQPHYTIAQTMESRHLHKGKLLSKKRKSIRTVAIVQLQL